MDANLLCAALRVATILCQSSQNPNLVDDQRCHNLPISARLAAHAELIVAQQTSNTFLGAGSR